MNMRLTPADLERIELVKRYFASLPVAVDLNATDVVRIALRELQDRIVEVGRMPPDHQREPVLGNRGASMDLHSRRGGVLRNLGSSMDPHPPILGAGVPRRRVIEP